MTFASDKSAERAVIVPRGLGYSISGTTGTMAAALAADAVIASITHNLLTGTKKRVFVNRIALEFTTIVAFTVPITAGRRLGLYRGSGSAPLGGAVTTPVATNLGDIVAAAADQVASSRIATTAALTVVGFTREAVPIDVMNLAHVGTAGAYRDRIFTFAAPSSLVLNPDESLVLSNPVAFDAAGTWQASWCVDYAIAEQLI